MSKASILIVEDESIIAEDIRFSLEANDYEVCGVFFEGEAALRRLEAGAQFGKVVLQISE